MRSVDRRRAVNVALAAAWAGAGCRSLVDPPLPSGAVPLTPPAVYARWWAMTEECSGLTGDVAAISWYVVPGAASFQNGQQGEANGYYARVGRQIVLAGRSQLDATVVRHEMLHALLRDQAGHPRAYFLGRCGGVVTCATACVGDAGPPPPTPAGTPLVAAKVLRVSAELSSAAPSASRDDGWFTLTVTATNPGPTAVSVAGGAYDVGWGVQALADTGTAPGSMVNVAYDLPIYDPGLHVFAAGETKRYVFDFHAVASRSQLAAKDGDFLGDTRIPAGRYNFRGAFGGGGVGPWSPTTSAAVSP